MSTNQANDNQKSAPNAASSVFRKGLGRTLFIWFLAFAIIPATVAIIFGYYKAHKDLKKNAENSLILASKMKSEYIHAYFTRMLTDLRQQSEMKSNVNFLEYLRETFEARGRPLDDFVKGFYWTAIVEEFGADLKNYRRTYGYHDVFLLDEQGNILFTVAGDNELGTNLFSGKYSGTLFAKTCKNVLETGRPAFSDFERYGSSNHTPTGFLVSIMVNEDGDKIGLLAFQIEAKMIDAVMKDSKGLGKNAETYLIGMDLKKRSNSVLIEKETILGEPVETDQTRLWYEHHIKQGKRECKHAYTATTYQGPHGKRVLGFHTHLNIAGVPLGMIAEVEEAEALAPVNQLRTIVAVLLLAVSVFVFMVAILFTRRMVRPILALSESAKRVAAGQFDQEIEIESKNEIGELAHSFNIMLHNLQDMTTENEKRDWFKTGQAELNNHMRGEQDMANLGRDVVTFLAEYLNAQIGAIYLNGNDNNLQLVGSYAIQKRKNLANGFELGEGLVGQAALEKERIILTDVPENYITVSSGLGEAVPRNILVMPFLRNDKVAGVVELGSFHEFSNMKLDFLNQVSENIAIAVNTVQSRQKVQELLEKTQVQTEELQAQQEELRQANEELEEQTELLIRSEAKLRNQQKELQQANTELERNAAELEEQAATLEAQKSDIQMNNAELEEIKIALEKKAKDLEISGKYKSEFLANMSHELRTPLNSILLLSKLLGSNQEGNLTAKQVEFAQTVHESGTDLLNLINGILDLSKVESGKIDLHIEDIVPGDIAAAMQRYFQPVAKDKKLGLNLDLADDLPKVIRTDQQRVEQILKNLLSNAFKFTSQGDVTLRIYRPDTRADLLLSGLNPDRSIAFSVSDTGVGIPEDKQKLIFEAFQQVDGTTSRKYGGTGLGLSISKELIKLLGGEIQVASAEGTGSTFMIYIPEALDETRSDTKQEPTVPLKLKAQNRHLEPTPSNQSPLKRSGNPAESGAAHSPQPEKEFIPDDRKDLSHGEKSILIIDDDPKFAKILRDLARERGFKILVAEDGETGLHFADYFKPSGIILDIGLPGMDGWTVMARLKNDPDTRHIPVHFVSAADKNLDAMKMGAVGYLTKPVNMEKLEQAFAKIDHVISTPVKNILVVEDDAKQRKAIIEYIGNEDIRATGAAGAQEAFDLLAAQKFDCIILDVGLPDMSGVELLTRLRDKDDTHHMPVIVYTGKELSKQEQVEMSEYAESVIFKGEKSYEKLLDDSMLFLHRVEADLPAEKREMIRMIHDKESILQNKKILLIDDDMRNVFALTNILEGKGVQILVGKNGREALERLDNNPDIDLVLMDIMMPEMDGYAAMNAIRKQERFKKLPIIALTAKAMKGDRAKCIQAGASDYLAKPVNMDKLISMLRVWLY